MPIDPEDLLVDWERRVQQQATLTSELSRRMEQNRASAESPGGETTVTVDSSGGMIALHLTEQAMRLPADELAAMILDTSQRAQATMARQMASLVSDLYGAGSETAAFIGGAYTSQFPEPPEDEEGDRR